ncbi:MAG: bifunctional 4-hydroxy-2-oxoglutarate aldolase/2-dehydro-3-deoxy-phosphogluconate aldolase [Lachnospiraceae bacterium]|nr:bifunctional 4-hydroxy-2-oxoglutarate aldolase/2-dehydro-3-deoxy-phosphogluconate aldolase [Lachnospiraceae bacterium]
MNDLKILTGLKEEGICAIVRGIPKEKSCKTAEALIKGGISSIEIAYNTQDASEIIKELSREFAGDLTIGAGTVLDTETAREAMLAGAQFALSPTLNTGVIKICQKYNILCVPGVATPTEMLAAWESGARIVKVFPAKIYGPEYIKQVKGPLDHISIMVVGGIGLDNIQDFIKSGADCAGIGSDLVNNKLIEADKFSEITERAKRFTALFKEARYK